MRTSGKQPVTPILQRPPTMIIEFQPRQGGATPSKPVQELTGIVIAFPAARRPAGDPYGSPFDKAPVEYQRAFKTLWPQVHAALRARDRSPTVSERRLGTVSHLALYLVDSWPESLKSFLWAKYGEGCFSADVRVNLFWLIDNAASLANLRPFEVVAAEHSRGKYPDC